MGPMEVHRVQRGSRGTGSAAHRPARSSWSSASTAARAAASSSRRATATVAGRIGRRLFAVSRAASWSARCGPSARRARSTRRAVGRSGTTGSASLATALGGTGAGQHADHAEQVQELGVLEPAASADCLLAQHGDVHGRAAERDRAKLEHHHQHLAERARWPPRGRPDSLGVGVGGGHGQRPPGLLAVAVAWVVPGPLSWGSGGSLTGRAGTARPRCRRGPPAGSGSHPVR